MNDATFLDDKLPPGFWIGVGLIVCILILRFCK